MPIPPQTVGPHCPPITVIARLINRSPRSASQRCSQPSGDHIIQTDPVTPHSSPLIPSTRPSQRGIPSPRINSNSNSPVISAPTGVNGPVPLQNLPLSVQNSNFQNFDPHLQINSVAQPPIPTSAHSSNSTAQAQNNYSPP